LKLREETSSEAYAKAGGYVQMELMDIGMRVSAESAGANGIQ
jgi:hypothetical protein